MSLCMVGLSIFFASPKKTDALVLSQTMWDVVLNKGDGYVERARGKSSLETTLSAVLSMKLDKIDLTLTKSSFFT
jgi:propanediol dehydratase small subunit